MYIYLSVCLCVCLSVCLSCDKQVWNPNASKSFQSPTPTHIASHLASHRSNIVDISHHLKTLSQVQFAETHHQRNHEKSWIIWIYMDNWREAQVHTSALSTNLTSRTSNSWNLRMLDWILLGRLTRVSSWKNSCDTTISHMEFIMVLGESPRVGKLLQPSSTYSFGFIWCSSTSDDTGDFSRSLPPSCHLLWKKAASAFGDGISILTNSSTTDSRRAVQRGNICNLHPDLEQKTEPMCQRISQRINGFWLVRCEWFSKTCCSALDLILYT